MSGPGNNASQPANKMLVESFGLLYDKLTLEIYTEAAEEEDYDGQ